MSELTPASALSAAAQAELEGLAVSVSEITDRGMIDLHGETSARGFSAAVKKAVGVDLPTTPRTSAAKGDIAVLWLSVDQWLVLCPRERTSALLEELRSALGNIHSLAVDMSDARTVFRLEGETVRTIMMKSSPVDFLPPALPRGSVRRLRFAEIAALVHVVDDKPDVMDLYVFRSFAEYTADWLAVVARKAAMTELFGEQAAPAV